MNVATEIQNNDIVLVLVPKEKYRQELTTVIEATDKKIQRPCYVCLNTPYNLVVSNLQKAGIAAEKFFFIDALTKNVQTPPEVENATFISSPSALTELSLAFSTALSEKKCDGALFDTLSTLLVYGDTHSIIQFTHDLLTKLRVILGKGILVGLKEDMQSELIKDLYMFVDKVVDVA